MTELLRTKLFIPRPRKNLVARPRLVDCLNGGLDKKLTLIAAPAGFGKTTLLSEWIPKSPRCITWLSLDEDDNDPRRFWTYFIASLQGLQTQLGSSALALLQSANSPAIPSILTALINDIAAFPDVFSLVLDDYHIIEHQPIHEGLTFLLDHLPGNMHLILTTRLDPPLPVSRLRARAQLTEIRANDLRFTVEEAAAFLTSVMGLRLSVKEVAALEARTEGWIAGLQIAALSMQGREDVSSFIEAFSGSHRHILGYLADEVINQQSESTLSFLLQTSILDRLCGSLCDAVTADSGAEEKLRTLERANLFIISLDDEGVWYRYHHLFADVLHNRLKSQSTQEMIGTLHRRASTWFEEQGQIDEAIGHALTAPDIEGAASLVEQYSMIMMQQSKIFVFRSWLEQLPDELVRTRSRLILAYGWSLVLTGHVRELEQWLEDSQTRAALSAADLPAEVQGELTLLRATLARFRRENDRSLELAQLALSQLLTDDRGLQAGAMYTVGVAHLQKGQTAEAIQALSEAIVLGETKGGPYMALVSSDTLSDIHIRQGYLAQARGSCQQTLDMAARWGWETMPAVGMAYIHLGRICYQQNDLEGAASALIKGIRQLRGSIEQYLLAHGYVALAQVHLARGDTDAAFATFREAEDWFKQMQVANTGAGTLLNLGRIQVSIRVNDLDTAIQWAQDCQWLPEHTSLGSLQASTLVRLRLAQNRQEEPFLKESAETVDRLVVRATAGQWWGELLELLILRSLLYRAQGDTAGMYASLGQAVALAEPEGQIRVWVDEGEPVRVLLLDYQSMVKQQEAGEGKAQQLLYMDKLLSAFPQPAPVGKAIPESLPEPLSERELEILRLIAIGRSNQEIAETLVIAVSTVKTHINNLYGKLGTNRRTEAIVIARGLGLLAD
jgi:LuxR family maltose regulon positive regulatory protein